MKSDAETLAPTGDAGQTLRSETEGLFVRKSSGLVREMGWRDAMSVALSGINPATVVAIFFVYLAFASNADLTLPYIVAAVAMIPLALSYGQLVSSMPRSGGDFVYLSRIFHPAVGAAIGVGFLLFAILQISQNAIFLGSLSLPEFFRATGEALNWNALVTFSGTLGNQSAQFITAAVIIVGGCVLGMFGARALSRTMFWCFTTAVVGLLIFVVVALAHSTSDFQSAYDSANGSGAYQNVISATGDQGISIGGTVDGFFKILPFAAIGFWGFTIANYPAGEIKKPGQTYTVATITGLVCGAIFLAIGWLAVRHMAGLHFLQASSALSGDESLWGNLTGGAPTASQYYVDLVAGGLPSIIISAAFAIGGLMFVLAMVLIISRVAFALAFDRVLPEQLADVNERTHAPIKALVVAIIGGLLFAYLTIYSTGFVSMTRNSVLVWAFIFTVGSIAAVCLPFRRRDLYEGSPKVIEGKWFGLPPIAVIAGISALIQGTLFYIAATNTSINGGYDTGSILTLVGIAVVGLIAYAISRAYLKGSKGIDLSLAMRELPPE